MTTTTTEPKVCPPSDAVDQIVRWSEVREGDLVLYEDGLIVAEAVHAYTDTYQGHEWSRVDITWTREDGHQFTSEAHGDRWTAVRRYVEGAPGRSQRERIADAAGSVHIGDVDPADGHLFPGDRARIADAVAAALGQEG